MKKTPNHFPQEMRTFPLLPTGRNFLRKTIFFLVISEKFAIQQKIDPPFSARNGETTENFRKILVKFSEFKRSLQFSVTQSFWSQSKYDPHSLSTASWVSSWGVLAVCRLRTPLVAHFFVEMPANCKDFAVEDFPQVPLLPFCSFCLLVRLWRPWLVFCQPWKTMQIHYDEFSR